MRAGGLDVKLDSSGFFWNSASDQRDLGSRDYGTSVVTFDYVHHSLRQLPKACLIRYQQAWWWNHQDLYVVRRQT